MQMINPDDILISLPEKIFTLVTTLKPGGVYSKLKYWTIYMPQIAYFGDIVIGQQP